jgi:hypothetical protein
MGKYTQLADREGKANPQPESGEKFVSNKLSYTYKHSILLDIDSNTGDPSFVGSTNLRTTNLTNLKPPIAESSVVPLVKEAALLADPPGWLEGLFELWFSGPETTVRNIATAVAIEIGMDPLEWQAIREEVEEALGRWEPA